MPNLNEPDFDELREHDGFRVRRARLGRQMGTERIGLSLWDIPPGQKAYPYHFHLTEEEVLVVLEGSPSLRTPDGSQTLAPGDVIRFPTGEQGAHQVWNETDEDVRLLSVSTHGAPDIIIYPDSGKLSTAERLPESDRRKHYFRIEDEVDYWDGETA